MHAFSKHTFDSRKLWLNEKFICSNCVQVVQANQIIHTNSIRKPNASPLLCTCVDLSFVIFILILIVFDSFIWIFTLKRTVKMHFNAILFSFGEHAIQMMTFDLDSFLFVSRFFAAAAAGGVSNSVFLCLSCFFQKNKPKFNLH